MKHLHILFILGLWLISINSFALATDPIIVSGSNDPLVNGTYAPGIIINGKESWTKGDYILLWKEGMELSWNIENISSSAVYYSHDSDTPIPMESGWNCEPYAVDPCTPPVTTTTPLPETLIVSGTTDSFLNGTYARGLNSNGYPRYAYGSYEIRQGWILMTGVWSIEDPGTGNQYYTHTDLGATVPEQGWLSGPYGNATSPPLVTESKLTSQYKVSGAGSSEVNGLYTRTLNNWKGLVYEKNTTYSLAVGYFGQMDPGYGIVKNGVGTYYYVATDPFVIPLIIPASGWNVDYLGTANPPLVTPYTFPWTMFLPASTDNSQP